MPSSDSASVPSSGLKRVLGLHAFIFYGIILISKNRFPKLKLL